MKTLRFALFLAFSMRVAATETPSNSVARVWDEQALASIRVDTPNPPVQARNLFSFSVCMYDAWSAYDTNGSVGFVYHNKFTAANIEAAREQAMSYAVWRMMKERHFYSKTAATTLAADDAQMAALGYDTNNASRDTSTPAGVGNSIYDAVSAWFINDGARQTNGTQAAPYPDYPTNQGGYTYPNPPLATSLEGINDGSNNTVINIDEWQRLQIVNAVDQNGFPQGPIQLYLGAQWLGERPYQMARIDPTLPWYDPGPPPHFEGATHQQFVNEAVADIVASSQLTPDDGATMDISPATYGNNSLAFPGVYGSASNMTIYDGHGYTNNPVTGLPYTPEIVSRGDFARVSAEFWADGPSSETPPGHWNVMANNVSDNTNFIKRIAGAGPVVNNLEWDVKTYFAVNASVHEAACAAWALKRYYVGWRPLSAVRYLAGLGQSSDPLAASYNSNGLPIITNLIELVTPESVASGRHAGLTPGKIAVLGWPGPPADPTTQHSGVKFIHGDNWITYQRTNFVTPAFPGYISGHSTFSRAGAEVLAGITGSIYFPGGLGTFSNYTLAFEQGPSSPITLEWATYYDAADGAGISRIWGGIHPPVDNLAGRIVGSQVGIGVWAAAQKYFNGSIVTSPTILTLTSAGPGQAQVRYNTTRAFNYQLQTTPSLSQTFTNVPGGPTLAVDSSLAVTNPASGSLFYRAVKTP